MTQEALKLALEALKTSMYPQQKQLQAITAIKEVLAEHAMRETQRLGQEIEQEPVAWLSTDSIGERYLCFDKPLDNDPVQPLFTSPPQRKPLNWEPIQEFWRNNSNIDWDELESAIKQALKEKNT